jgi:hypothetical protein
MKCNQTIKNKIYSALSGTNCEHTISRVDLAEMTGLSERVYRYYIEHFLPDVGGLDGYFLCRTDRDWSAKNEYTLKLIKSLCGKYRRSKQEQMDQKQIMMKRDELEERGECPEYLVWLRGR